MNVNRYYHILIVITDHSVPFGGIMEAIGFLSFRIMMISGEKVEVLLRSCRLFSPLNPQPFSRGLWGLTCFSFFPNEHNRSFNATVVAGVLTDLVSKFQNQCLKKKNPCMQADWGFQLGGMALNAPTKPLTLKWVTSSYRAHSKSVWSKAENLFSGSEANDWANRTV